MNIILFKSLKLALNSINYIRLIINESSLFNHSLQIYY